MDIEEALADMAAATSALHLGRPVTINGLPVDCVKVSLKQEEATSFAGGSYGQEGLAVEGLRLTVDQNLLQPPPIGGRLTVDGATYDVRLVSRSGSLNRITLTRYLA